MKKVMTIFGAIMIASLILTSCGGSSSSNNSTTPGFVNYCAQCGAGIREGQTINKMGSLAFCSHKQCLTRYRLEN